MILKNGNAVQIDKLEIQVRQLKSDEVNEVERFEYLGSVLQKNGSFKEDIKHRNKCGWIK